MFLSKIFAFFDRTCSTVRGIQQFDKHLIERKKCEFFVFCRINPCEKSTGNRLLRAEKNEK